jgi:hypothetical protein
VPKDGAVDVGIGAVVSMDENDADAGIDRTPAAKEYAGAADSIAEADDEGAGARGTIDGREADGPEDSSAFDEVRAVNAEIGEVIVTFAGTGVVESAGVADAELSPESEPNVESNAAVSP